jgi:Lrp/AsnC family leucine-responsive transcriptional regulator
MTIRPGISDPKGLAILRALQTDCDRPRRQLAQEIGVSEPYLSKSVAGAKVQGLVRKVSFILNPEKLGFKTLCFFTVAFADAKSCEAAETELAALPQVQEIHTMAHTGLGLFIKFRVRNNDEFGEFKRSLMGTRGRTGRVETFLVGLTAKEPLDVPI